VRNKVEFRTFSSGETMPVASWLSETNHSTYLTQSRSVLLQWENWDRWLVEWHTLCLFPKVVMSSPWEITHLDSLESLRLRKLSQVTLFWCQVSVHRPVRQSPRHTALTMQASYLSSKNALLNQTWFTLGAAIKMAAWAGSHPQILTQKIKSVASQVKSSSLSSRIAS